MNHDPSPWISVIGTIGGAVVGLLGGVAAMLINRKGMVGDDRKRRTRESHQELYRQLLHAEKDFNELYVRALGRLANGTPLVVPSRGEGQLQPIFEIEMLVDLFLPQFKDHVHSLIQGQQEVGKLLGPLLGTGPLPSDHPTRQGLVAGFKSVNDLITKFKKSVSDSIEP